MKANVKVKKPPIRDPFRSEVETHCDRMRAQMARGPLHPGERARVIDVLEAMLGAEAACVARYQFEYRLASTRHGEDAARSFLAFARDECEHFEAVAARLRELGCPTPPLPEMPPDASGGDDRPLEELVRYDLASEHAIVDAYAELAGWLEPADPASAELVRTVLASEQAHIEEVEEES